jgi:hypothetical protein
VLQIHNGGVHHLSVANRSYESAGPGGGGGGGGGGAGGGGGGGGGGVLGREGAWAS